MFTSPEGPGVCFVTQGPFEASHASEETRDYLARRRTEIEDKLRQLFEKAIETGELPPRANATELALYYSVVLQGMALQARHGSTKEQLEGVIDTALAAWPKPA